MKGKKDSFLLGKETWERKLRNKKGAEMTVGTIIIIVLALIVLVVLVLGFTGGWSNLWGRITSFFGGSNVDSIVQACQVACSTESKYDYCERNRSVKWEGANNKIESAALTCNQLETSEKPKVTLGCDIDCGTKGVNCVQYTIQDCPIGSCRVDDTGSCVPL